MPIPPTTESNDRQGRTQSGLYCAGQPRARFQQFRKSKRPKRLHQSRAVPEASSVSMRNRSRGHRGKILNQNSRIPAATLVFRSPCGRQYFRTGLSKSSLLLEVNKCLGRKSEELQVAALARKIFHK